MSLALSPSGRYVATDWDGKSACVLQLSGGTPQCFEFNRSSGNALGFSSDERLLLALEDKKATLRDVATGHEQRTWAGENSERFASGCFSSDGKLVAIASGNAVKIWDLLSGQKIRSLVHDYEVYSAVFSPRGRYLASESGDPYKSISITRVWDLKTGQEINRRNPGFGHLQISFGPDGRTLFAQGQIAQDIWLWRPEDLMEETCARVHRNLTPAEWDQYLGKISYSKACPRLP